MALRGRQPSRVRTAATGSPRPYGIALHRRRIDCEEPLLEGRRNRSVHHGRRRRARTAPGCFDSAIDPAAAGESVERYPRAIGTPSLAGSGNRIRVPDTVRRSVAVASCGGRCFRRSGRSVRVREDTVPGTTPRRVGRGGRPSGAILKRGTGVEVVAVVDAPRRSRSRRHDPWASQCDMAHGVVEGSMFWWKRKRLVGS